VTVQSNRHLAGHCYLGDPTLPAHRQVEKLTTPLRIAANRRLRGLHQQEAQQRIALFADVSQSSPVST
jgi:hypothetical protein